MKLIGVLLIIVSFPIMFFFIAGTDVAPDTFNSLIEGLLCRGDERYSLDTSPGYRPGLTYIEMTCISPDGGTREITLWYFAVVGISFIVPFMLGLIMLMRGLGTTARLQAAGTTIPVSGMPGKIRINDQTLDLDQLIEQARTQQPGGTQTFVTTSVSGGGSLAEKLRQLQEAYDAGLLTQAEYETQRRQIMREFGGG